jgi:hypothetical protein
MKFGSVWFGHAHKSRDSHKIQKLRSLYFINFSKQTTFVFINFFFFGDPQKVEGHDPEPQIFLGVTQKKKNYLPKVVRLEELII